MSSIIDYTDRATCVIFGDGAGAVILEPDENDSEGLIDFLHEVDGSGGCSLYMPGGGSLHPSTQRRLSNACTTSTRTASSFQVRGSQEAESARESSTRNGLKGSDVALSFPTRPTAGSSPRPRTAWDLNRRM